jgi:hypothetical protein
MRVYLDLGYDCRAAVDLTPAELDTLTKVLDRARPVSGWWHGDAELKLAEKRSVEYNVRVVPASVKLVEYVAEQPTTTEA